MPQRIGKSFVIFFQQLPFSVSADGCSQVFILYDGVHIPYCRLCIWLEACVTKASPFLCLGVPSSSFTQVVHSAGRRFIVSPVPESRLKEQGFFTSALVGGNEPSDMGELARPLKLCLGHVHQNCAVS